MNFSEKDFISAEEILSDVMSFTGEERLEGVTKGFIYSQMNKCLEELSYHTFFNVVSKTFPMPSDYKLDVPAMVFNIKEIYGYNGDACTVQNSENIYWKRNFFSPGTGAVARSKEVNTNDPFYSSPGFDRRIKATTSTYSDNFLDDKDSNRLYYYGYEQGRLFFSQTCGAFSNVLIKFNGIWVLDTSKPSIPRYFRQVITDWCVERVFRKKKILNPNLFRIQWSDAVQLLDRNGFNGSWYEAEKVVKRMSTKEKQDLNEYLSRLNY